MARLRKMLGDIQSEECIALMRLIEKQSKKTLATWAIAYVQKEYFEIYANTCSDTSRLGEILETCKQYLNGMCTLREVKPHLNEAAQIAREIQDQPVAQAAARAIATACASIQTPTNALGFLFYGAAAYVYAQVGIKQEQDVYDKLATTHLQHALHSLQKSAIENEPNPVNINWNC